MKTGKKLSNRILLGISPWVILGSLFVMVPIFSYITMEGIRSQRDIMTMLLSEKGDALIRSFEAGTRTGMMGMNWSGAQVQRLIMETAEQPDILYILITDKNGTIVAHNQPLFIGKNHGTAVDKPNIGDTIKNRVMFTRQGKSIFEVYRRFNPSRGKIIRRERRIFSQDWFSSHMLTEKLTPPKQIIYIGLDMAPIEKVIRDNIRQKIVVAIILLLFGFLGIVSIIFAQNYRLTKATLSRIKAFSDNLVNNMPIGLIFIEEDGRLTALNDTSEKLLMLSTKEVIGKKATDVLPAQIAGITGQIDESTDLISKDIQYRIQDKKILLEISASILKDDNDDFIGHIILLRDISEIDYLKKEVQRSERLASLGSLAAGIAHEIRNPLSSIKGFATYFKQRYKDVPEDQKTADIMISEVERLNRAVSQLLEFARPMHINKKDIPIIELVSQSIEMIANQAEKHNISIDSANLPQDECIAVVDPDKVRQVLLNIFLNAIEAMDEGGAIKISYRDDHDNSRAAIGISDTGCGIDQKDIPHVFDPYFTTKQTGTGLGLAIAHKIIEAHGGELNVESEKGKGTTVSIILPVTGSGS